MRLVITKQCMQLTRSSLIFSYTCYINSRSLDRNGGFVEKIVHGGGTGSRCFTVFRVQGASRDGQLDAGLEGTRTIRFKILFSRYIYTT